MANPERGGGSQEEIMGEIREQKVLSLEERVRDAMSTMRAREEAEDEERRRKKALPRIERVYEALIPVLEREALRDEKNKEARKEGREEDPTYLLWTSGKPKEKAEARLRKWPEAEELVHRMDLLVRFVEDHPEDEDAKKLKQELDQLIADAEKRGLSSRERDKAAERIRMFVSVEGRTEVERELRKKYKK